MPVNTSYLNHGKPIGFPSIFTVASLATTVNAGSQIESSFSVPARLLPQGVGNLALRAGDPIFVGPPSSLSAGLMWSAYAVPTTNSVTLRFVSASTVSVIAGTWTIAYCGVMP